MISKKTLKQNYTFTIEVEVMKGLRELKNKHGLSMSALINSLLKDYIVKKKLKKHNVPLDKIVGKIMQTDETLINPRHVFK